NLCAAAPVGLFLGRLANFVNGELYGRPTSVPWSMKFPEEAASWSTVSPDPEVVDRALAVGDLVGEFSHLPPSHDTILHLARTSDGFAAGLEPLLTPRHP